MPAMEALGLPALAVLLLVGAALCLALCFMVKGSGKATSHPEEEGPQACPMPSGFRWLDEDDGASDEAATAPSAEPPECEVLELPGDESEAMGIAFVCGNPGCAHAYATFCRSLQESLAEVHGGRRATLYIIGMANYGTRREYLGPVLTLEEEATRMSRALARVAARHRESGLIIVCNSVSSSGFLQLLIQAVQHGKGCLAGVRIPLVLFLTPWLEFDFWTFQGVLRAILGRSFMPPFLKWCSKCLNGLSMDGKRWVADNIMHAETEEERQVILATLRHQHHTPALILLTVYGFQRLDPSSQTNGFLLMDQLLREEGRPEIAAFYAESDDLWASTKHMRRLKSLFLKHAPPGSTAPPAELGCLGAVKHDFSNFAADGKTVAQAIAPTLAAGLRRAGACPPLGPAPVKAS